MAKMILRHTGTAMEPKVQRVSSAARYCIGCDTFMSRRVCKACGMDTEKVPARDLCTLCDGDGYAMTGGGNCPRCNGSGKEAE